MKKPKTWEERYNMANAVNVKTLPDYQGEGIGTHAYSSTCSYANRTTYEPYYDLNKISEFQNTGLEIMYEQSISVGMYEYALPTA